MSVTSTATQEARRRQIVAATVEVVAAAGLAQASFARIAQHAGLSSTRLISYHFADRADLLATTATSVIAAIGDHVTPLVTAAGTAPDRLAAYLRGVIGYIDGHRSEMRALQEIVLGGALPYDAEDDRAAVGPIEALLREGQRAGELRDFDPVVVANAVQRAVDGLPFLLASRPETDCAAYAEELVTLFDLGTRAR